MVRVRKYKDYEDLTLLFRSLMSIKSMVGTGVLVGAVVASLLPMGITLAFLLGLGMVAPGLYLTYRQVFQDYKDPLEQQIIK